jgi:hypothetical protein
MKILLTLTNVFFGSFNIQKNSKTKLEYKDMKKYQILIYNYVFFNAVFCMLLIFVLKTGFVTEKNIDVVL